MARLEGHEPAAGSDKDLTVAFQHGDDGAFEAIYARHYERVRATCRRLLGSASDAEEATQETFLRCYRSLGRFNGQYQLGAWLSRIATNVCVDILRARSRAIQLSGTPVEEIDLEASEKAIDLRVEDSLQLTKALADIQPLHAEALYLRAVEGLSHEEMAGRLEMTAQQVKSLLHRSRSSFRRMWDNASGWSVAPLLTLRSLVADRSREASTAGQGVILTSPGSALLAEKVAAGAVAVVVAFTGMPTETQRQPTTGRPATPRIAQDNLRTGPSTPPVEVDRTGVNEDSRGAVVVAVPDVLDEVERAERELQRAAEENHPQEPGPEDPVPGGEPGAGAANKEVRKVVREAKETLGSLP